MKSGTDKDKIKALIQETITLLCRNGLEYRSKFSLEALIGITLDEDDILLININETVKVPITQHRDSDDDNDQDDDVTSSFTTSHSGRESPRSKRLSHSMWSPKDRKRVKREHTRGSCDEDSQSNRSQGKIATEHFEIVTVKEEPIDSDEIAILTDSSVFSPTLQRPSENIYLPANPPISDTTSPGSASATLGFSPPSIDPAHRYTVPGHAQSAEGSGATQRLASGGGDRTVGQFRVPPLSAGPAAQQLRGAGQQSGDVGPGSSMGGAGSGDDGGGGGMGGMSSQLSAYDMGLLGHQSYQEAGSAGGETAGTPMASSRLFTMYKKYTKEDLDGAVDAIHHGGMSARRAALHFHVPKSTLQYYAKKRRPKDLPLNSPGVESDQQDQFESPENSPPHHSVFL